MVHIAAYVEVAIACPELGTTHRYIPYILIS